VTTKTSSTFFPFSVLTPFKTNRNFQVVLSVSVDLLPDVVSVAASAILLLATVV
jgi:hypothetical protein